MNHLVLIVVILTLLTILKVGRTVLKASKRINALYEYFIVKGNDPLKSLKSRIQGTEDPDRPDPNDGSGCPKEEDLKDGDGN